MLHLVRKLVDVPWKATGAGDPPEPKPSTELSLSPQVCESSDHEPPHQEL